MLVPCNSCHQWDYTEESALWYVCDKCLTAHQRAEKKRIREMVKEWETWYCDGCGLEFKCTKLTYSHMYYAWFCDSCHETEVG